jgi:hypothetical protein
VGWGKDGVGVPRDSQAATLAGMLGLKARDLAVWVGYCAMLAAAVPWHEPWRDEAQAWLLARDLSIPQLLLHNLRYEGHPGLWYLILWGPAHLHVAYAALGWIAAGIAAAGTYVLLRLAPFPFYLRAALPFTFFLAYQFAVVARSYVLFPLLCFLIAHVYRESRPVTMAVLLGLLANVSVHGTLVACGMAVAYGWRLWRGRGAGAVEPKRLVWAVTIFAAAVVAVVATIYPPKDIYVDVAPTVSRAIHSIAVKPEGGPQADAGTGGGGGDVIAGGTSASGVSEAQPASKAGHLAARLADLPRVLCYSVSTSRLLCVVLYALLVAFLFARGQLFLLTPLMALALFLGFIYAREWHLGLVWVVLLMILWAAWDTDADVPRITLQRVLAVVLAIVSALQIPWTWRAIHYDRREQYYPSQQAAAYLHTLPAGLRIAGFWDTTTILPYFDHNIFFNQPRTSFNWYSTHNRLNADAAATLATRPDVVVVWSHNPGIVAMALADGYRETHRFCGAPYLPNVVNEESCYVFLEPGGRRG